MSDNPDRDGTCQPQRFSQFLAPDGVVVDGLPREALLAFAARFAGLLRYYDASNQEEGSFAPFFELDLEVQLSLIATSQPAAAATRLRQEADRLALMHEEEPVSEAEWARLRSVLRALLGMMDGWWRKLGGEPLVQAFCLQVKGVISRELAPRLCQVLAEFQPLRASVLGLDADLWGLNRPLAEEGRATPSRQALCQRMKQLAWVLERCLQDLAAEALRWLRSDTLRSAPRAPHVALLCAFLRLLEYPRQRMNELPARHLKYFYEEVLGQVPRPATPDRTLVTFFPAAQALLPVFLPRGTLLAAGKDSRGQERTYRLLRDTSVDAAAVARVLTLWVRKPERASSRALEIGFTASAPGSAPPAPGATGLEAPWPAFGAAAPSTQGAGAPVGHVGFALASQALLLAGGTRTITVSLQLGSAPAAVPPEGSFRVRLSGPTQWLDVPCQTTLRENTLTLTLVVDASLPAVVPYQSKLLGPGFPDGCPVLLAVFEQGGGALVESSLAQVSVQSVRISVNVQGTRAFSVASMTGPLALGKPFAPFGYAPPQGALFMVGCAEAFQKRLLSLSLHLSWLGLPAAPQFPEGFASYYNGYELALGAGGADCSDPKMPLPPLAYGDASFKVQLQYRRAGAWQAFENTGSPRSEFQLFSAPLSPRTDLTIRRDTSVGPGASLNVPETGIPTPFSWDALPPSGVLGVRLTAPAYGFGQALHPPASATLALRNMRTLLADLQGGSAGGVKGEPPAQAPSKKPDPQDVDEVTILQRALQNMVAQLGSRKLPSALSLPYTPMVEDLSLDYSAEAELGLADADGEAFFLVGPLGTVRYSLAAGQEAPTVLPPLDEGGSLFLGFGGLTPRQPVSCLFLLQGTSAAAGPRIGRISWSYQSGGKWKPLRGGVSDQTDDLRRSGIVTFMLPSDADDWTLQQASGVRWVRGQVSDPENYPTLLSLRTQATWCERVPDPMAAQTHDVPLPAGSMTGLVLDNPGIAAVSQPLPSHGGKPPEDLQAFYSRVSERCRHKGRAVTSWDYERLVLEAFPWVFAARCLPGTGRVNGVLEQEVPGAVSVLVYPRTYAASDLSADAYPPTIDAGRLEEIRAFLAERASADVQVSNPSYVLMKVTCTLAAASGHDPTQVAQTLNDALRAFVSPWIFSPGSARALPGTPSAAHLLRFIKTRDYVGGVDASSFRCAVGDADEMAGGMLQVPRVSPWNTRISAWRHDLTVLTSSR
jgi:hypothetical protein